MAQIGCNVTLLAKCNAARGCSLLAYRRCTSKYRYVPTNNNVDFAFGMFGKMKSFGGLRHDMARLAAEADAREDPGMADFLQWAMQYPSFGFYFSRISNHMNESPWGTVPGITADNTSRNRSEGCWMDCCGFGSNLVMFLAKATPLPWKSVEKDYT